MLSDIFRRFRADGSSVLIHFGYPQAHEDDAERAVRVGLGVSFANTVSRSCSPASGGAHFTSTPASADWPIEKRTCWPRAGAEYREKQPWVSNILL